MKKKTFAFFDLLIYAIVCVPLIGLSAILLYILVTQGTHEWLYANWHLVLLFAISFVIPIGGIMMFRYVEIKDDFVYFHYFSFAKSWKKAANNIDITWNQQVFISEIKDIEIVKLTKEEKESKVFYTHLANKYMKINLKHGKSKYIYVGNYSNLQIKKIITLVTKNT